MDWDWSKLIGQKLASATLKHAQRIFLKFDFFEIYRKGWTNLVNICPSPTKFYLNLVLMWGKYSTGNGIPLTPTEFQITNFRIV